MAALAIRSGVSPAGAESGIPARAREKEDSGGDENMGNGRPTGTKRAMTNDQARAQEHQMGYAVGNVSISFLCFVNSVAKTSSTVETAGARAPRKAPNAQSILRLTYYAAVRKGSWSRILSRRRSWTGRSCARSCFGWTATTKGRGDSRKRKSSRAEREDAHGGRRGWRRGSRAF